MFGDSAPLSRRNTWKVLCWKWMSVWGLGCLDTWSIKNKWEGTLLSHWIIIMSICRLKATSKSSWMQVKSWCSSSQRPGTFHKDFVNLIDLFVYLFHLHIVVSDLHTRAFAQKSLLNAAHLIVPFQNRLFSWSCGISRFLRSSNLCP